MFERGMSALGQKRTSTAYCECQLWAGEGRHRSTRASKSASDPKRTCNALGYKVRYFKEDIPRSHNKIRRY